MTSIKSGGKMSVTILRTLAEQIEPGHTAVIVIDPQKDYCASDGSLSRILGKDVSRLQEVVKRMNPFIEKARQVGLPIVWVRTVAVDDKMRPSQKVIKGEGDEVVIVREDGDGKNWYSEVIKPLSSEHVITKFNYDAFENTDLDLLMRSKGTETLIFIGVTANVCVETSARHAFIKGYYVVVVSDCTDSPTCQEYESALFNIEHYFGNVATSDEILKLWQRANG
jgi:ureidoacrylate peracid hydrolase